MKNVLITGISRGLGKATAELLLEEGYTVYGTYNTHLEGVGEHKNLHVFQADLSKKEDIKKLVAELDSVALDGIVNSAGVFLDIDFQEFNVDVFESTFNINTFAPLYIVQGLQANLREGAAVVNVASNDALVGSIAGLAYSASKAALLNLTQSMANILAPRKIRANAVAPGWMGDGMDAPEELLAIAKDLNPLKKIGTYKEVAEVISFLLSSKSSYINGTTITIDGGDMATSYILQKEAELLS